MNPVKRKQIFKILARAHGKPSTELNFRSNFELLVAVILSAQATDISVNKATDTLYRKANTPQAFLNLGPNQPKAPHSNNRSVQHQSTEHHQNLSHADRSPQRTGAFRQRSTGSSPWASAVKPQTSS